MALSISDRGYVLETGRLVAEDNPETLWNNDEIRAAYLGGRKAGYWEIFFCAVPLRNWIRFGYEIKPRPIC
jgi:hypothetical protein